VHDILHACHDEPCGGHYATKRTTYKILQVGYYWPTLHRDAQQYTLHCDECQRMGKPTKRNEIPLQPQVSLEPFDKWGMDFIGPIDPPSGKKKHIQQPEENPTSIDYFSWKNVFLLYHDHIYLCKNSQLKLNVILEFHTSPIGGHSRFFRMYHRIKKDIFWEGLKIDVQNYVSERLVYQQNKGETLKILGLLQPLAIPSQCWEEVSMDFIIGLPKS
jgi:hypothetical protein